MQELVCVSTLRHIAMHVQTVFGGEGGGGGGVVGVFFNDTATTEIYTLSLHDALPILTFGYYLDHFVNTIEKRFTWGKTKVKFSKIHP